MLDAGSAGGSTMLGLKKYIADRSRTRVLALVNVALEVNSCFTISLPRSASRLMFHPIFQGLAWAGMAGGAPGGELDNLNQVSSSTFCPKNVADGIVHSRASTPAIRSMKQDVLQRSAIIQILLWASKSVSPPTLPIKVTS